MQIRQIPSDFTRACGRRGGVAGAGFTLIELLAVIAIIAVMAVLTVPAMRRVNEGQRMGKTVADLTALLEYARTEAMARSTYVWVGFNNRTNTSGNAELAAIVFASRDGTATVTGTGTLIEPLSKMSRFEGIQLTDKDQLCQEVRDLYLADTTAAVSTNTASKSLPVLQGITFDRTLTIAPSGEAMLLGEPAVSSGFDNVIDISLRPMRGAAVDPSSKDHASIWFYGASGRLQLYRLQ